MRARSERDAVAQADSGASTAPMTPLTPAETPLGGDVRARVPSSERPVPSADAVTGPIERQRALVAREETHGERRRLLWALGIGIVVWNGYLATDLVRHLAGDPNMIATFVSRLAISTPVTVLYFVLRARPDASASMLRAIELYSFTSGAIGTAVLAILENGLLSLHLTGVPLVLLSHALMMGRAWRRALVPVLFMTFAQPVVLLVAAFFDSALAAQWRSLDVAGAYLLTYTQVLGAAALTLFGGHTMWSLRQKVAESRSIGRYRLRTRIATGGMGEIWSAYHAALKRDVAVKLMQPRLGQDERAVARFEQEARALAELTHPYVVRVFDYGATEDGIWYYAMELLDGEDLRALVAREGALAPARAVRVVRQAAEALAEAHAHGIVHRDVKPANILLVRSEGAREFVKLIDFGIAKLDERDDGFTQTGMIVGTPGYIAPEVIRGEAATPRADVYALGAVLYYLLTAEAPLEGETPKALVMAHLATEPVLPSARLGHELPDGIDAIVMRCLHKDPTARFADAGALASELRNVEEDLLEATRSVF